MNVTIERKGQKLYIKPVSKIETLTTEQLPSTNFHSISPAEFDLSALQAFTNDDSQRVSSMPLALTEDVDDELYRQYQKWGPQSHHSYKWMTIIQEELGEIAQALLNAETLDKSSAAWNNVREEIIQTIACLVQLYVSVEE